MPALLINGFLTHGRHGDIAGNGNGSSARRLHKTGGFNQCFCPTSYQQEPRAEPGERHRTSAANAGTATGNQDHTLIEIHRSLLSPSAAIAVVD
jgi:hypothetical protein